MGSGGTITWAFNGCKWCDYWGKGEELVHVVGGCGSDSDNGCKLVRGGRGDQGNHMATVT